jgi:hypothetical protein
VTYQPLQIVSAFPVVVDPTLGLGQALQVDPTLATTSDGYLDYDADLSLNHELSRRSALAVNVGYSRRGRVSDTGYLSIVRAGGRFSRELARGLRARVGYELSRGGYVAGGPTAFFNHHNIDAGVDYSRALSVTQRTTFAFGSGSTVVSDGVRSNFEITGFARLNHDLGRSWNTSAAYRREVGFLGTLNAPVFSDSLAVRLSGLIADKLHVHAAVGAAIGDVGLGLSNSFRTYYSTTGATFGVTQYLGFDVTYSYFRSKFETTALLAPGVPDEFQRQSVRASVRLWAPLIYRVGRTNVAR